MTTVDQFSTVAPTLERFVTQWAALLTTFRRNGTPVGTPVNVVVRGPVAYARTFEGSGKIKRLRRNPRVEIAPCTPTGRPTGPEVAAVVRILEGQEAAKAARALAEKYPIVHGYLIPFAHRIKRVETIHLELRPV
jgi:PPOX class probable F420-dependent enzyme